MTGQGVGLLSSLAGPAFSPVGEGLLSGPVNGPYLEGVDPEDDGRARSTSKSTSSTAGPISSGRGVDKQPQPGRVASVLEGGPPCWTVASGAGRRVLSLDRDLRFGVMLAFDRDRP